RWATRSAEHLVELVLLLAPDPRLDGVVALHAVDEHVEAVERLAVDGARRALQRDDVVLVADDVLEVGLERAAGQLGELPEVPEDGLAAVVVTGGLVPSADVPHGVLRDDLREGVHVVVGECLVTASKILDSFCLGHVEAPFSCIVIPASALSTHSRSRTSATDRSGRYARKVPSRSGASSAAFGLLGTDKPVIQQA